MKIVKTYTTHTSDGKIEFQLCQTDKETWLQFPPQLRIVDDVDGEHIVKVIQEALNDLEDDWRERNKKTR